MKILVACEHSGIVRDSFLAKGHDAISCDILDTDVPGPHHRGDVLDILNDGWDLMIAHPPCTFLTNAANRWLYEDSAKSTVEQRLLRRDMAIAFFKLMLCAPVEKIAVENPFPHKWVVEQVGRYSDMVQPWMFGDPESKGVYWWLKNLPPLMSTVTETNREQKKWRMSPGPERDKMRSQFFPLMAEAMADQWGDE